MALCIVGPGAFVWIRARYAANYRRPCKICWIFFKHITWLLHSMFRTLHNSFHTGIPHTHTHTWTLFSPSINRCIYVYILHSAYSEFTKKTFHTKPRHIPFSSTQARKNPQITFNIFSSSTKIQICSSIFLS